ncbi:WcaI family glycosyltransferase [Microvirga aerophila]|uniref:Glycosyltransferase WbuB n=1 Tax=Microvirga aerophila TaxID=670291 RepID=A0A512BWI7_9HYPH|nr:WcaI family glycosyltransferase [Microvirga aerophila]GEO16321.1 glycosyltransferase WbuB [Microvirga aerophila]
MRLLIQTLNYAPDEIGIPKYSTEMAEWFARQGWEVRAVTAPPYYPQWRVGQGYKGWAYARETRNDVSLLRCPLYVPAHPSGPKRLVHLASFAATSAPAVLAEAVRFQPDAVLAVAPNLMAAPAAALAAKLTGAASILHVQDFELDIALRMGLMKGKGAAGLLAAVERSIMRGFDRVSAPAPAMVARLMDKGVAPERAFLFRNWCDTDVINPDRDASSYRQEWGVGEDDIVLLYSGNLSEKQGVLSLVEAARHLADKPNIHFVICGAGPAKKKLAQAAQGLSNVRLLPLQPIERLPELLCAADIHLLPQVPAAADLVLPSKLSGMLASGRPVIATVAPGSGIAQEIDDGGLLVAPGDVTALCQAIVDLSADRARCAIMRRNARQRAETNWAKDAILSGFEARVKEAIRAKQATKQSKPAEVSS